MLINLLIGLPVMLLCLVLQTGFTFWTVRFYTGRRQQAPTLAGPFWQIRSLLIVMIVLMLGNFLQIMIWGLLFMALGEFGELYEAVYHSAVNFSSLGYGDVVMSKRWKLLGLARGVKRRVDVCADGRRADGHLAAIGQGARPSKPA